MSAESILFKPIRINRLEIANRWVFGPVAAHSPSPEGRPTAETAAFYARRAAGGVGLIIVGSSTATASGWDGAPVTRYTLRFDRDDFVPDLRRVTEAVHAHGVPLFAQLNTSMGRMSRPGPHLIAASAVNVVIPESSLQGILCIPGGISTPPPRPATVEEIHSLVRDTVAAAERMQRAGFDGVEIGAHMSYFIASFLSSRTNRRDDDYGGSIDNRARILLNLVRDIRAATGPNFPIGVRMTANEHTAGGQGADDYARIAALAEAAGADYFALTDGAYEVLNRSVSGSAGLVRNGEARVFRAALRSPILLQGIHDADAAAAAVSGAQGDMIMLVRPLLADPDLVAKVRGGRADTIARCDSQNQCLKRLMMGLPIRCPVNPQLGAEARSRSLVSRLRRRLAAPVESAALRVASSPRVLKFMAKRAAVRSQPH